MSLPHEAKNEVERFLQQGEKLGAIQHLIDAYGFTLAESQVIIEALEQTGDPAEEEPAEASLPNHGTTSLDELSRNRVMDLLIDGQKVEAIKFVQESLNIPLNTARDQVAEIERYLFNPARAINPRRKKMSPKKF